MDKLLKGSLFVTSAAIIWGGTPIIEKAALNIVNPMVLGAWRYFLAGLVLFVYLRIKKVNIDIGSIAGKQLFIASLFNSTAVPIFFYYGLSLTDPVTTASIGNTGVLWVALLGTAFLKEKIKTDELAGTLLILFGVYAMLNGFSFESSIGAVMVAVAALSGAIAMIIERKLLHRLNPLVVTLYDRAVGGSISLIAALFLFGSKAVLIGIIGWAYLIFLAIFGALLPAVLFFNGLKLIEAERSAAILSTAPLFTLVFTLLFMNVPITQSQVSGALLIFVGVIMLSMSRKILFVTRNYVSLLVRYEKDGVRRILDKMRSL
ncbi:MAG: DMT family transporter [Candidatus Aenigmatarchaeota archaeon]